MQRNRLKVTNKALRKKMESIVMWKCSMEGWKRRLRLPPEEFRAEFEENWKHVWNALGGGDSCEFRDCVEDLYMESKEHFEMLRAEYLRSELFVIYKDYRLTDTLAWPEELIKSIDTIVSEIDKASKCN